MVATRSDQIREQVVQTPWSIFISKNYQNDISKWPDIKDDDQRREVVRRYGVSKTSTSFRYQLKRLCDVLSQSDSLRYQLVRRCDVSNWSVLFTTSRPTWDLNETSLPHRMPGGVMLLIWRQIHKKNWPVRSVTIRGGSRKFI